MALNMKVKARDLKVGDALNWSHVQQFPYVQKVSVGVLKVTIEYRTKGKTYKDEYDIDADVNIIREDVGR